MQGFYVNMVYHSYPITHGGDKAVLDEPGWVADWVALMKQVQQSDVCKVSAPNWHSQLAFATGNLNQHSHLAFLIGITKWHSQFAFPIRKIV